MKWTGKLILLLVVMAAAVAFLSMRTAQGTDDSSDGPLYQNTLNQAFTEMRTVRNVPESNEHGEDLQDLLLGRKPEPTKKPRNTKCPPDDTRCPVKGTKCPKKRKFTKCEVTHNKDAPTKCFDESNYTKCRAKTYYPEDPTKCTFPWWTTCKVTHDLGSSGRTRCFAPKTVCLAKRWCWPVPHDLGVTMIDPPGPTGCNPYVPTVHVKNFGLEPASFFDVFIMIMTSGDQETKTIEDTLGPGETMSVEFSPIPLPEGDHEICATTIWTPDQNPDNDEMCAPFHCGTMDGPALSSRTRIEARALALFQSYPNPFSDRTSISFMIPAATHVTLRIYDVTGSVVTTLVDGEKATGLYTLTWDATDLNNGVYFYRMVADGRVFTGKTMLIR
ncbi:T9SS type A sorting domain-containing protein [candidate division TA06 bacterium]|uniref:T9SS type A sorting domain-containing protein n=1 Tax=candidate division TA06 bacterium TaxID=2250710 RepID=A0A523UMT1_UNCT6|nr:MAG: T9SS type A sorting domain-containing protein [candidate division TA06 bacterium]